MRIIQGPNPEREYGKKEADEHFIAEDYKRLNETARENERDITRELEKLTDKLKDLSGEYMLNKKNFGGAMAQLIEETAQKALEAIEDKKLEDAKEHIKRLGELVRGNSN